MRWLLLLTLPVISTAQPIMKLSNSSSVYKKGYQFSSIVIYDNKIILPSERCDVLIMLDLAGKQILDAKGNPVPGKPIGIKNAQIEGIALFKDFLLLVDETVTKKKVYVYNLISNKLADSIKLKDDFKYTDDKYGIEGIAVNERDSVCYILQEKTEKGPSRICQYKIVVSSGEFDLEYQQGRDLIFNHEDPFNRFDNQRYTDIVYADNGLYLLGSYFIKIRDNNNQYFIDFLAKPERMPYFDNIKTYQAMKPVYKNLSEEMRPFNSPDTNLKYYSTNLEGLTLYNNEFYLVTDNVWGRGNCSSADAIEKTLLFKLKRPH